MQAFASLEPLLDLLSDAVFLVDARGFVLARNASAQELADERDGVRVVRGRLEMTDPCARQRFREAIEERAEGRIRISVRRSDPPDASLVMARTADVPPRWSVVVSRPDHLPLHLRGWLCEQFGFTPAEARLVDALVRGESLKEAAARFGVRESTARVQLKSVFAKTNVRRQAELVAHVFRALPAVTRL
ncbi:MAG TPA: hypothetical protein RMH85_26410 [Polyangiaceae bacterium LLY-WYZ-15_(1-7)]|nr:hypothetical protein [Polyangiaceae bacterium LLY-WYZ-15_(1-7)]HJL12037.1 hypothetical protein [Polyangiaceae bacterium LLY-WYZ-15_(1-7)]HJL44572.1 hypothetical protein [Polyangiaceae bacterium LLY-WYZ-15_(1-7)]